MENKKKNKTFRYIILLFFSIFLILYITNSFGYSEFIVHNRVSLTEEQINEFENDIKEGKNVNTSDYINYEYNDYSNKFSNAGAFIGKTIDSFMNKVLKNVFKVMKKLFYEN